MGNYKPLRKAFEILENLAIIASYCFASMVVFTSCLVLALPFTGLDIGLLNAGATDLESTVDLFLTLSVSLGVATFLASYIMAGNISAYAPTLFAAIFGSGLLYHPASFVVLCAPTIIGGLGGYYLNRYSFDSARICDRETPEAMTYARIFLLVLFALPTLLILRNESYHLVIMTVWVVQLGLLLAPTVIGINRRACRLIA